MARFAQTYPNLEFVQQAVAQISGDNIVLLDRISDPEAHIWHIDACQRNGWFRAVLIHKNLGTV